MDKYIFKINLNNFLLKALQISQAFTPKTIIQDLMSLNIKQSSFLLMMLTVMGSLSVYWGDGVLGMLAGLTGVTCVFLVNMKKLSNFAWGFINCTLYGWVAYTASYYGDFMLNWFFYLPAQLIGAYMWYDLLENDGIRVKKITSLATLSKIALGTIGTVIIYSMLLTKMGGSLTLVDATTTTLSILATYFMVKGYREQWLCWIVVNVLSIYMWINVVTASNGSEGVGVLIMWVMFFLNSVYGTYTWFKSTNTLPTSQQYTAEELSKLD